MRLPICAALLLALCLGCARQQPPPMTEADVRALLAIWQGLQPKAPEPPKAPMQKAPMPQPKAKAPMPQPKAKAPMPQPKAKAPMPQPKAKEPAPQEIDSTDLWKARAAYQGRTVMVSGLVIRTDDQSYLTLISYQYVSGRASRHRDDILCAFPPGSRLGLMPPQGVSVIGRVEGMRDGSLLISQCRLVK